MATIRDVLAQKGAAVQTIEPDKTVLAAAQLMNEQRIGALVVVEADQVAGIVTERDVLRRVVAEELTPGQTTVGQVMTRDVVCAEPEMSVDEARSVFMQQRIRHLPVVDRQSTLRGMVSLGDINAWQLDGQEVTIQYLHQYLYGVM
jgi:CBS domain-containing protein